MTRTDCQHEEHKQGLKQFPIFSNQARPELKGRRRTKPRSDRKSPPNFNYIKISDHFKPKPVSTVRPGTEGEPSTGDSVVVVLFSCLLIVKYARLVVIRPLLCIVYDTRGETSLPDEALKIDIYSIDLL